MGFAFPIPIQNAVLTLETVMKKHIQPLFGFILCLGLVSFAPTKSFLGDQDGRMPASEGEGSTTVIRRESSLPRLFVFGPLVIYKRTQRIEEVRTEYRRLQADVDKIAQQKAEIERLLRREDALTNEASRLRSEFARLVKEHASTRSRLLQLQEEFGRETQAMQSQIDALTASRDASEAEKEKALALLEAERANALALTSELDDLKSILDSTKAELSITKEELEKSKAEALAKEEELQRIRCENEDAIASLKDDIKKLEKERDEITRTVQSYEDQLQQANQQNQNQMQMMMMAMAQFSFQAMNSPQYNPYLMPSSLFDPNFQMLYSQQAQLVTQMTRQHYMPQITNNYYGNHTFIYGSGHDFMNRNFMQNDHYSMFPESNLNGMRTPSSQSALPGYFNF